MIYFEAIYRNGNVKMIYTPILEVEKTQFLQDTEGYYFRYSDGKETNLIMFDSLQDFFIHHNSPDNEAVDRINNLWKDHLKLRNTQ